MRKTFTILLSVFMLFACQNRTEKNETGKKPVITVSILPQKFFIEQITGDYFSINVMVPPGADPHNYEPTPRQMAQLAQSEYYFFIGHLDFEIAWIGKIVGSAPNAKLMSNSMGIELIEGECLHDHADEHHHNHSVDPHIWTSPKNVKTMATTMYEALIKSHPDQKPVFETNLNSFLAQVDSLDIRIANRLSNFPNREFMIYHPALAYFASDYQLIQHSVEYEGKTPSPAQMKKTVDLAKAAQMHTIFIQSQFETSRAEAIAREINAEVVAIDPLAYNWFDEMESLSLKIEKALQNK